MKIIYIPAWREKLFFFIQALDFFPAAWKTSNKLISNGGIDNKNREPIFFLKKK